MPGFCCWCKGTCIYPPNEGFIQVKPATFTRSANESLMREKPAVLFTKEPDTKTTVTSQVFLGFPGTSAVSGPLARKRTSLWRFQAQMGLHMWNPGGVGGQKKERDHLSPPLQRASFQKQPTADDEQWNAELTVSCNVVNSEWSFQEKQQHWTRWDALSDSRKTNLLKKVIKTFCPEQRGVLPSEITG